MGAEGINESPKDPEKTSVESQGAKVLILSLCTWFCLSELQQESQEVQDVFKSSTLEEIPQVWIGKGRVNIK